MASKSKGADEAYTIDNSISSLIRMAEDVRTHIADLKAARERMENTRISKGEALQRLDSWLEDLQKSGAVAVRNLTYREPYKVELIERSQIDGDGYAEMTKAAAALVYFFPDLIRIKLASEIDAEYDNAEAIASTDYPRRLADIEAKLFAAEMEEEKIIQRAEDSGLTINRRHDVNPRVLLDA